MLSDIAVFAPAKVNIGLKVLKKRPDGFHGIESIFQTVSLYDKLEISLTEKKKTCIVESPDLILPEQNTITQAYSTFTELTGIDTGIHVKIEKQIPSGGGLGGGSSDGASCLKALFKMFGVELTESMAFEAASKIGSDVFFFLLGEGCALVSGRGENVSPIKARDDLHFVMVFPKVHSSTKEAYALIDQSYEKGKKVKCPEFGTLEQIYRQPVNDWNFKNSFTPLLAEKYPQIKNALDSVISTGADWADMSGSGATVFGVYRDQASAQKAFLALKEEGFTCVTAE